MKQNTNWKGSFFRIYVGQAFSILSSSAVQFSIIWWITSTTGSALAVTLASIAGLLPQAVIGPFAGVWIDRFNRKTIMMLADGVVAIGSLLLFLMCFLGTPPLWIVYLILFIRALGETFHKPALSAAIPQLVPGHELTKAAGLGQMVTSACSIIGPMLGAILMSITSLQVAMLVDIIGAGFAVLTLSFVRIQKPVLATGEKIHVFADMKLGFATIKQNKPLLRILIPVILTTLIFTPIGNMLPLMVKNYFHGGAWHNGFIQTIFSAGMLICAGAIGIWGGMKRQFLMISSSITILGIASTIGGLVPSNMFFIFCFCVFIIGGSAMGFNIPFNAYLQRSVPQESLGKVMSLMTSVLSFTAPVGMLISGPIAEFIGVSNWMIISGVLVIITGILAYLLTRKIDKKEVSQS
jgi:DHA3 family macrolide efflux protein-like MFS transporter